MGCACGCESTEEELLVQLADRRQRWEYEWSLRTEEERDQGKEKYQKTFAHLDGLVRQVKARLAERLAPPDEPSQKDTLP